MTQATIASRTIDVDAEGFLVDHAQWNAEVAADIAAQNGIHELTPHATGS
jgi:sulfur relay (sulfurtransferase) DsrC/TusE family protein